MQSRSTKDFGLPREGVTSTMPTTLRLVPDGDACPAACIGCTKQNPQPAKPPKIHWHSPTGYEDTKADKSVPAMPEKKRRRKGVRNLRRKGERRKGEEKQEPILTSWHRFGRRKEKKRCQEPILTSWHRLDSLSRWEDQNEPPMAD